MKVYAGPANASIVKFLKAIEPQVISHGPKVHEIKGPGFHGFFESPERGLRWAKDRMSGKPYNPIPKAGEV